MKNRLAKAETCNHVWGIRADLPNADGEASPELEWQMPRETDLCLMRDRTLSIDPRAVEALRCGRAFRQVPLLLLEAPARSINLRLRDLGMSTPLQNAKVQSPSKLAETEAMIFP